MDVKEKLVELLSYFADGYSVENRHIVGGQKVCEIADHLIAHGVTVQKWISVKDRLPEEDKDVLAFCYWHESWQVQVCHLSSNWNGQWHTSVAGQWVIVSHWQYLPQPPKGE